MNTRARLPFDVVRASIVLLCTLSCSESPSEPPASVPSAIILSTSTASFAHIGQTMQITASVTDQNGKPMNAQVSWSTDAPAVATVSNSGVIAAAGNGTTTVRATAGSAAAAAVAVTVEQQAATLEVSATTVALIGTGATHALTAIVRDAGGHPVGTQVTWTSSNDGIVSASSNGTITAIALGAAVVTAHAATLTATVDVSVSAPTITIQAPAGLENLIRGVNVSFTLVAEGNGPNPLTDVRWSSSNPAVAAIDNMSGVVHTVGEGTVSFTATAGGGSGSWTRDVVRIREMPVDAYLATPIQGALWEVPVILIEYHPTADGYGLDTLKVPDFYSSNPISLDSLQRMTLRIARRRKMSVEEGSRFRGYGDAAALPSLGYRVVRHIIVYDQIPPHPTKRSSIPGQPRFEDWNAAFADLDLVPSLREHHVREVWAAWTAFDGNYPSYNPDSHKVEDMRAGWESNMSSPTTGDISNSDRDPHDAPVIDHTYIIYGINFRRSQAEAVHNVGHQLESMLSYINIRQDGNQNLFWRSFVGQDVNGQFITGRAGWTHMPPNTTQGYDYLNPTRVDSDIEDWRPDNTGAKKAVNVNTWGGMTYPWPDEPEFGQRVESQWYTYWFQSFPGRGNQIPHGSGWLTNWWAFVADWDAAVTSGLGLYASVPAAQNGTGRPYPFAPAAGRAVAPEPHRR